MMPTFGREPILQFTPEPQMRTWYSTLGPKLSGHICKEHSADFKEEQWCPVNHLHIQKIRFFACFIELRKMVDIANYNTDECILYLNIQRHAP